MDNIGIVNKMRYEWKKEIYFQYIFFCFFFDKYIKMHFLKYFLLNLVLRKWFICVFENKCIPIFHNILFFSLQFYDLIERNKIAMSNLQLRSLTIFAPTNEAFQKYNGSPVQVQYHMCKYKYKGLFFWCSY